MSPKRWLLQYTVAKSSLNLKGSEYIITANLLSRIRIGILEPAKIRQQAVECYSLFAASPAAIH